MNSLLVLGLLFTSGLALEATPEILGSRYLKLFRFIDTNKDHRVSPQEFRYSSHPRDFAKRNHLFNRFDSNKDQKLDFYEFSDAVAEGRRAFNAGGFRDAFRRRDINGDGQYSFDEKIRVDPLLPGVPRRTRPESEAHFKEIDVSRNGKISPEEFRDYVNKLIDEILINLKN